MLARTGSFKNERRRISRAFKIGDNLDRALLEQSQKMGITPSSLVNQILIRYFDWDKFLSDGSTFLTLDRQTFAAMIENLSEDRIIEIARSASLVATHNFIKFRYNEINSETVLDYLELMSTYMNLCRYKYPNWKGEEQLRGAGASSDGHKVVRISERVHFRVIQFLLGNGD